VLGPGAPRRTGGAAKDAGGADGIDEAAVGGGVAPEHGGPARITLGGAGVEVLRGSDHGHVLGCGHTSPSAGAATAHPAACFQIAVTAGPAVPLPPSPTGLLPRFSRVPPPALPGAANSVTLPPSSTIERR